MNESYKPNDNWGNSETGDKEIERDMWVKPVLFEWVCKKCHRPNTEGKDFAYDTVECDVCGYVYQVIDPR